MPIWLCWQRLCTRSVKSSFGWNSPRTNSVFTSYFWKPCSCAESFGYRRLSSRLLGTGAMLFFTALSVASCTLDPLTSGISSLAKQRAFVSARSRVQPASNWTVCPNGRLSILKSATPRISLSLRFDRQLLLTKSGATDKGCECLLKSCIRNLWSSNGFIILPAGDFHADGLWVLFLEFRSVRNNPRGETSPEPCR